jgi:hypothetical protein
MPLGVLPDDITLEFGDFLLMLNGVAITLLLTVLYGKRIVAGSHHLLRSLRLSRLLPWFSRGWRAVRKTTRR